MMTLYYFPGACSLTINIALRKANLRFDLAKVDYETRLLPDGSDFRKINNKANVPALLLDCGTCLTETIAILDWIDFEVPDAGLIGARGSLDRQRALTWLSFVGTEIHKSLSPMFRPETPAEFRHALIRHLSSRLLVLETHLASHSFLSRSSHPQAADYYLFVLFRWLPDIGMDVQGWPGLRAHAGRIARATYVKRAVSSEAL